jgi:uncharacterized membrane protein YeaQ/YmgE (transglycosylase-associated protein family)
MGLFIMLVVGAIIGWLASMVMNDAHEGVFLNMVFGIAGAVIAGMVINPLMGGGNIMRGDLNLMSLVASFLGAVALLVVVNLFRRGSVR